MAGFLNERDGKEVRIGMDGRQLKDRATAFRVGRVGVWQRWKGWQIDRL